MNPYADYAWNEVAETVQLGHDGAALLRSQSKESESSPWICVSKIDMNSMLVNEAKKGTTVRALCNEVLQALSKSPLGKEENNPNRRFMIIFNRTIYSASDRKYRTVL